VSGGTGDSAWGVDELARMRVGRGYTGVNGLNALLATSALIPSRCRSRISGRLELDEGFHHRTQRSLRRNVGVGVTVVAHRRVSATYVTGAATLAIYVLLPRTSVTQTTSRVFPVGESDADSPDSGGCVPPALSLPSWRAAPCGSVPIVFREKKASCDVSAPSGPCSGSPLWPGAWPPSPPAARAFIPVACGEGALVAAVHQANGTLAADILVSF
jgi:hypothetical protein